jgi:ribonuclease/clavin/mitogillin
MIKILNVGYLSTNYYLLDSGRMRLLVDAGVKFILLQEQEFAATVTGNILLPVAGSREFLHGLGFAAEFVHTPGHSDDSISLVLDSGEAFVGDLPLAMPEDADDVLVRQSRDKLRAMGVRRVYPGHGNHFELPH